MISQSNTMKDLCRQRTPCSGSWRVCVQSALLFCYLAAQILFYVQLNNRLNDSLTRLDKLEFLLSELHSKEQSNGGGLRSSENKNNMAAKQVLTMNIDVTGKRYMRTKRSDVATGISELQQRIESLETR